MWLFDGYAPTVLPGVTRVEVSVGEPALELSPPEAAELFSRIVAPQAPSA